MVTDRQNAVLRKVLAGFGEAKGLRPDHSHWEGRSFIPLSGSGLFLGV